MENILSYLFVNSYPSLAPAYNLTASVCRVNGQEVECPAALNTLATFGGMIFALIAVVCIVMIVAMWKIYTKAGQPGWSSIIPIYNTVVLLEIVKRPIWWIILMFIPFVNVVIGFIVIYDLSKAFGKGIGYMLGLIFLPFIFYPILAFGKSQFTQETSSPMPSQPMLQV